MPISERPHFKNESEEAQWWFDHRDELEEELVKAMDNGTAGPGVVRRFEARIKATKESEEKVMPLAS